MTMMMKIKKVKKQKNLEYKMLMMINVLFNNKSKYIFSKTEKGFKINLS